MDIYALRCGYYGSFKRRRLHATARNDINLICSRGIQFAFKTDKDIIRVALCATAMPLGLNTVVFPAAYGGDITPGAGKVLISHLISIITIPIMFSNFI